MALSSLSAPLCTFFVPSTGCFCSYAGSSSGRTAAAGCRAAVFFAVWLAAVFCRRMHCCACFRRRFRTGSAERELRPHEHLRECCRRRSLPCRNRSRMHCMLCPRFGSVRQASVSPAQNPFRMRIRPIRFRQPIRSTVFGGFGLLFLLDARILRTKKPIAAMNINSCMAASFRYVWILFV